MGRHLPWHSGEKTSQSLDVHLRGFAGGMEMIVSRALMFTELLFVQTLKLQSTAVVEGKREYK